MYDPNAGQTDDAEAAKVLTEILEGWHHEDMVRTDPDVLATDILVELPRRGWHLQRIAVDDRLRAALAKFDWSQKGWGENSLRLTDEEHDLLATLAGWRPREGEAGEWDPPVAAPDAARGNT